MNELRTRSWLWRAGLTPQKLGLPQSWQIIGMGVNEDSLQTA
jgi:hypothetical protein